MKKQSLKQWCTVCFRVFLVIFLTVSIVWSLFWTNYKTLKEAGDKAETVTELIRQMLKDWDLDSLSASDETELYRDTRAFLRSVCQNYALMYLYLYTIDPETKLRTFIFCAVAEKCGRLRRNVRHILRQSKN